MTGVFSEDLHPSSSTFYIWGGFIHCLFSRFAYMYSCMGWNFYILNLFIYWDLWGGLQKGILIIPIKKVSTVFPPSIPPPLSLLALVSGNLEYTVVLTFGFKTSCVSLWHRLKLLGADDWLRRLCGGKPAPFLPSVVLVIW